MNQSHNLWSRMTSRIAKNRKHFYWALPLCFVLVYVLMLCVPRTYSSSFSFVEENQQALDNYRVLTLNDPANYDLGLAQTRNAIDRFGYGELVFSSQFLQPLFLMPVSTLDGKFEGTYADYVYREMRKPFWMKAKSWMVNLFKSQGKDLSPVQPEKDGLSLSRRQAGVLSDMRKQIRFKIDDHTDVATVEIRTQDPQVSAQVAHYVEQQLHQFAREYQHEKMQQMLNQIAKITCDAEQAWHEAERTHAADVSMRKGIYESFYRQQLLYQAQMMSRPALVTLSDPIINYQPVAPRRMLVSLLVTFLLALGMGAWFCRREIAEAL